MPNPTRLPMLRRSIRNLFARPATRRYPTEVRPRFAGARGTIEFDLDSCVFCGLCARRCPAVALTVSRENKSFAIEQLRCIACGVCVEVCNKNSLHMSVDAPSVRPQNAAGSPGPRPGHEEWHREEPPVAGMAGTAEPAAGAATTV